MNIPALLARQHAMHSGRIEWSALSRQAGEALDVSEAADLLELALAALSSHADRRSDVEALLRPAFNAIEDLVGSLRLLPPGHEHRAQALRDAAADLRRRMAREAVDA